MEAASKSPFLSALETVFPIFTALAAVLAIRLFLLIAVVGAFFLAQAAMTDVTNNHDIWVLVAFCTLTILPLSYLDLHGKKRG